MFRVKALQTKQNLYIRIFVNWLYTYNKTLISNYVWRLWFVSSEAAVSLPWAFIEPGKCFLRLTRKLQKFFPFSLSELLVLTRFQDSTVETSFQFSLNFLNFISSYYVELIHIRTEMNFRSILFSNKKFEWK